NVISDIGSKMSNLSTFRYKENSNRLNNVIGDLLDVVVTDVVKIEGINFNNINFIETKSESGIIIPGEIQIFLRGVASFFDCDLFAYNNKLIFELGSINELWDNKDSNQKNTVYYFSSSVAIRRLISTYLTSDKFKLFKIYIPKSSQESNDDTTIKADELEKIFMSLKVIVDNVDLSKFSTDSNDLIQSILIEAREIFSNDKLVDELLISDIFSSTISIIIYETLSSKNLFEIPNELILSKELIDDNINAWISRSGELKSILKSLTVFDFDSFTDNSFIFKIDEKDLELVTDSRLYSKFITTVFEQIKSTVFDVVILDSFYNDSNSDFSLEKNHIIDFYTSMKILIGYEDGQEIDFDSINFNINNFNIENVNQIFKSEIIEISISKYLLNILASNDVFNIPSEFEDYESWVIDDREEAKNMIISFIELDLLNEVSAGVVSFTLDKLINSNLELVFKSNILNFTISNLIEDQGFTKHSYVGHYSEDLLEFTYEENDLIEFFTVMNDLSFESVPSFSSLISTLNLSNATILLNSNIYWLTISYHFKDADGLDIYEVLENNFYLFTKESILTKFSN
ncbi:MAG: hypothetical protein ACRC5M_01350, partial [Anaeroplasmataceae bacterium]